MHEPKEGESDLHIQKIKVRDQDDVSEHMDRKEFGRPQRCPKNWRSNGSILGLSRLWAGIVGEMSCGCGLSLPADSKWDLCVEKHLEAGICVILVPLSYPAPSSVKTGSSPSKVSGQGREARRAPEPAAAMTPPPPPPQNGIHKTSSMKMMAEALDPDVAVCAASLENSLDPEEQIPATLRGDQF